MVLFFKKEPFLSLLATAGGWPAFGLLVALSLALRMPPGGPVRPAEGDVPAYLTGAYHLRAEHFYSAAEKPATRPGIGREPAYPLFLASLMAADPAFGRFTLACLHRDDACAATMFRVPRMANLLLILSTGTILFGLGRRLTGRPAGGLIAAGYLLLDTHANKLWGDLMSDRLALFLVALAMLALSEAWRTRRTWHFAGAGMACAALVLTKAIFLPFLVAAWCVAAAVVLWRRGRAARSALIACGAGFTAIVGGWILRNWTVSGMARLTDQRSGIALSTRAVFDGMSSWDYLASFVYWSGSQGAKLARRLFGDALSDRFSMDAPGGYYDLGQNGYAARVAALMQLEHLPYWQAASRIDAAIVAGMRQHWLSHLATTLPLAYRGLWLDEFFLLGVPCLALAGVRAFRAWDWLLLLLLSAGMFNIIGYAVVSLNVERYQMTAVPALALATAIVLAGRTTQQEGSVPRQ